MREFSRDDLLYAFFGLLAAIAVIALLLNAAVYMDARRKCLAHGWRDAVMTWDMSQYCIRTVDATEIVLPLSAILSGD